MGWGLRVLTMGKVPGIRAKVGMHNDCRVCGSHKPLVPGEPVGYVCKDCYSIGQQLWPFQSMSQDHLDRIRQYRWGLITDG